jgi:hypothetical protein
MALGIVMVSALTVGFLAGGLSLRHVAKFCPVCGVTLACPERHPRRACVEVRS